MERRMRKHAAAKSGERLSMMQRRPRNARFASRRLVRPIWVPAPADRASFVWRLPQSGLQIIG
jgi:hypothetical protein